MEFAFSRNSNFTIGENVADSLHARKDMWLSVAAGLLREDSDVIDFDISCGM